MIKAAIVAVSCMWGVAAFAQPAGSLIQVPNIQFFDTSSGRAVPLAGGNVYTYSAGTTTPLSTYANANLSVTNSNPILLNSNGYNVAGSGNAGIWLGPYCYKIVLKTAAGVTIYTQDNVCNDYALLKASLVNVTGAGVVGFSQTSTYNRGTVGDHLQNYISVRDDPYNAVGDGTADDTIAIQGAMDAAITTGRMLYFPHGSYAVSSIIEVTASPIVVYCDGPHTTTIIRHSGSLQSSLPLLKVTNSANVTIRNCGWNELGDGTNYTNNASTVYLQNVASSTVDNNYSTLGQSNAFIYVGSNNISFTNNELYHIWNAGIAVSGTGTVGSPVYAFRVDVSGNRINDMPAGIQISVFTKDVTITGNTLTKSAIGLVQAVYHSTISGNTLSGSASYGNPVGPFDCIFLEGVADFVVSGNWVNACTRNGIFAQGSELSVGSTLQLPILRGSISANHVDGAAGAGIQVIGASFDHSLMGKQWAVSGNTVTNADIGIVAGSSAGAVISGNNIAEVFTDGIVISVISNIYIENNSIRNVGQLTPNSWYGINIGDGTEAEIHDIWINNNTITDTLGNMRGGVVDTPALTGHGDAVRHCGNRISGYVAGSWFPPPAIPTLGVYTAGDCIENFPTAPNQASGWFATASGTPGNWAATGFLSFLGCVSTGTPEHCGTSSSGVGIVPAGVANVIVESTAVKDNNAILLQEDQSLGTVLGVTCNTNSLPLHIVNRVGTAYFTAGPASVPVTNPLCFSWRVVQQQ